jgi:hypothetical protein
MGFFFVEELDSNFFYELKNDVNKRFNKRREQIENHGKHDDEPYLKVPVSGDIVINAMGQKTKCIGLISEFCIDTENNDDKCQVKNQEYSFFNDVTVHF